MIYWSAAIGWQQPEIVIYFGDGPSLQGSTAQYIFLGTSLSDLGSSTVTYGRGNHAPTNENHNYQITISKQIPNP
jgi:hypothetical protein